MKDQEQRFSDRVADFSEGWLDKQLTEKLSELVKAVKVTGKKGEITLKLTVTPRTEGDGDVVIIKPTIVDKVPKIAVDPEVFRAYDDGDLEVIPQHGLDGDDERQATRGRH